MFLLTLPILHLVDLTDKVHDGYNILFDEKVSEPITLRTNLITSCHGADQCRLISDKGCA